MRFIDDGNLNLNYQTAHAYDYENSNDKTTQIFRKCWTTVSQNRCEVAQAVLTSVPQRCNFYGCLCGVDAILNK